MNPEILRLIEEGAVIHLSGSRYNFNAALNTGTYGNPYWLIEVQGDSPEAALNNLLNDESVQPEVDA
ncbi:hypothetical protein [Deinococcus ruber]|uniref:Uncharacterized protein n=1 Tax=Deinococcus ruber TaxID=1848197 RepID=A0A918CLZ3_9DEIO|nr:hypothetical protein [Deinococcus ruber]GGR31212.1 hypothetical protein GCM10008957_47340 [Deinococcus ruber]